MQFHRIYDEDLAQASYLVGCPFTNNALVVDPMRDVDRYLDAARDHGLTIVAVAETHIHADFLSGARELAHAIGARLYLSGEGGAQWSYGGLDDLEHTLLRHDDVFHVGAVRIEARHTPGHTPEHLSFLVTDPRVPAEPMLMLTGDFVFVADLGRPDLLDAFDGGHETAHRNAEAMFDSLRTTLLELPGHTQIWPGHGAGSACGRHLDATPCSTVGFESTHRWWGRLVCDGDRRSFVEHLLDEQPEVPLYFAKMKTLNRDGMPRLGGMPVPTHLTPGAFGSRMVRGGALLVDTRSADVFAREHVRGAYHVPQGAKFATWAGWVLPYYRSLVLLAEDREAAEALMRKLVRIGHDDVAGYITDLDEVRAYVELEAVRRVDAHQARRMWESDEALVLDVRSRHEFAEGHIPGALNIHAGRLMGSLDRLPRDRPLIVHCSTGQRSSVATSALMANGFDNVCNYPGSYEDWQAQGFPVEGAGDEGLAR